MFAFLCFASQMTSCSCGNESLDALGYARCFLCEFRDTRPPSPKPWVLPPATPVFRNDAILDTRVRVERGSCSQGIAIDQCVCGESKFALDVLQPCGHCGHVVEEPARESLPLGDAMVPVPSAMNVFTAVSLLLHGTVIYAPWYEARVVDRLHKSSTPKSKISLRKLLKVILDDVRKHHSIDVCFIVCIGEEVSCEGVPSSEITVGLLSRGEMNEWFPVERLPAQEVLPDTTVKDDPVAAIQDARSSHDHSVSKSRTVWDSGNEESSVKSVRSPSPSSESDSEGGPFKDLRYPTIELGETNFVAITKAGIHPQLKTNRIHFLATAAASLVTLAIVASLLGVVSQQSSACCHNFNETTPCFFNATDTPHANCSATCARLRGESLDVFLWSSPLAAGTFCILVVVAAALALGASLLTNFFHVRSLAQRVPVARFWKLMWVVQVLLALLLEGGCILIVLQYKGSDRTIRCDGFQEASRQLCRAARTVCNLELVGRIDALRTVGALSIVALVFASLNLLGSLLPPSPSDEVSPELGAAVPDTRNFRPGKYCPNGITPEQCEQLSEELREEFAKQRHHQRSKAPVTSEHQVRFSPTKRKSVIHGGTEIVRSSAPVVERRTATGYSYAGRKHNGPARIPLRMEETIERIVDRVRFLDPDDSKNSRAPCSQEQEEVIVEVASRLRKQHLHSTY